MYLAVSYLIVPLIITQPLYAASLLGHARLFSNDTIGDGDDRWRTSAYWGALTFGDTWSGRVPDSFGDLRTYYIRGEIIAPSKLSGDFNPHDRRFAGALTFGAATHFMWEGFETTVGGEFTFTGPQTGLAQFHSDFHEILGFSATSDSILDNQIENNVYPSLYAELRGQGVRSQATQFGTLYPFVQFQVGVESYARLGVDLIHGPLNNGAFLLRDASTGHLVPSIKPRNQTGWSLIAGADIAVIADSNYFPDIQYERLRKRARLGTFYDAGSWSAFYGLTYFAPEFRNQLVGQVVGSINIRFFF